VNLYDKILRKTENMDKIGATDLVCSSSNCDLKELSHEFGSGLHCVNGKALASTCGA
jgi:hypothetical protein